MVANSSFEISRELLPHPQNVMRVNTRLSIQNEWHDNDIDINPNPLHRHRSPLFFWARLCSHSFLGEGAINNHVEPVVSHVYAKCSGVQIMWELPPVEVVCSQNFYYFLEIKSSELGWLFKHKVPIWIREIGRDLPRNQSYSLQLTAFDLTGRPVGSPWRQNITVIPSGMK